MTSGAFLDSLRQLSRHLTPRRKRQIFLLLGLMLVGAAAELLSLGAVIPFVTVLADPVAASQHRSIAPLMSQFDIGASQLPFAVSLLFAGLVVSAMAVRLTMTWATIRYASGLGAELGERLYTLTLQRPYSFHVSRNSSHIIGSMAKVQKLTIGYLQPLLTGITAAVLSVAIVGLLVAINPTVALGGALIFGSSYFLVALLVRRRLRRNGGVVARTNDQRIQALQEGLGGIRDVILDRAHRIYGDRYSRIEQRLRRAQASSQFTAAFPRVAIEAIAMLLMVAFALLMVRTGRDLMSMLPLIGLLAIGAQKLVPLLQQIYAGWSAVASNQQSVDDVLALLDFEPVPPLQETIEFQREIILQGVGYAYGPALPSVLSDIHLRIGRGEKLGIVGPTGSGKSTLVDLLMGLLLPTEGLFLVDGREIRLENAAAWQSHIAHVPQSIYLSDASIAENIAFGVPAKQIDVARLESTAHAAQIHEHVMSLPRGYGTTVGERGVRLSGGQRQRIGIARALYKGADVLVLDEATSALDDQTEARVMRGIAEMGPGITVIMIAHRLHTMKACDRIVRLDAGRITEVMDFASLIAGPGAADDAPNSNRENSK